MFLELQVHLTLSPAHTPACQPSFLTFIPQIPSIPALGSAAADRESGSGSAAAPLPTSGCGSFRLTVTMFTLAAGSWAQP